MSHTLLAQGDSPLLWAPQQKQLKGKKKPHAEECLKEQFLPPLFFFPSFQSPLVIMGVKNNIWWLFLLSLSGYGAWARMESSLSSGHSPTLPHTGGDQAHGVEKFLCPPWQS